MKVSVGQSLDLRFLDRKWFFYGVIFAFRIWQVLMEITKIPLYFVMRFLLILYQHTSLQVPQCELPKGKGGPHQTRSTVKWFKKCQRCESKQQLIYVLKEVSDVSKVVLMYCLIILSNGYKLFPNNQFNAGQYRGQKSPWRHWCLKSSWSVVPETFQSQMLKLKKNIIFWDLIQTQNIFSI